MAIALLFATIGAQALTVIGWLGLNGKLARNPWAGIRTPYTMASDENWQRVHRAGGLVMLLGGVAALAIGLAVLPFSLAGVLPDIAVLLALAAMAVITVTSALASAFYGIARAKAEDV